MNVHQKFANFYAKVRKFRRHAADTGLTITKVCQALGLPQGITGPAQEIAIVELGGGYDLNAINSGLQAEGLPPCTITDVSIDGATNQYVNDSNDASVEVMLDAYVAAGVYSYMTGQPAKIKMVFCQNTGGSFTKGAMAAKGSSTCSISWGAPEDTTMDAYVQGMDAAFSACCAAGTTVCCAAGDNGSSDGTSSDVTDFPGSSPYVVNCGGSSWVLSGNAISNESVWNHDGGASGGGFSKIEPVPSWQRGFVPATASGRGGPDFCSLADPNPGYAVPVFGAIGGTSAVAPLMAGFLAVVNMARQAKGLGNLGLANPFMYAKEAAFFDVVAGNDGTYSATQGWDAASGLGGLRGNLFAALVVGSQPPPPPPPPPPPSTDLQAKMNHLFAMFESETGGFMVRLLKLAQSDVNAWFATKPPMPTGNFRQQVDKVFVTCLQSAQTYADDISLLWSRMLFDRYLQTNPAPAITNAIGSGQLLQTILQLIQQFGPVIAPTVIGMINSSNLPEWEKTALVLLVDSLLGTIPQGSQNSHAIGSGQILQTILKLIQTYGPAAKPIVLALIEASPLPAWEKMTLVVLVNTLIPS